MKKHYVVSVKSAEDWEVVHELLTQDGTLEDNIPTRACECTSIKPYSATRSTYLLDDEEIELLKNNQKIAAIHIDENFHPEEAPPKPNYTLREVPTAPILKDRFNSNVLNVRDPVVIVQDSYNIFDPAPGVNNLNRTSYQLSRLVNKNDPWEGYYTEPSGANYDNSADFTTTSILSQDVQYVDDGTGVDVIVSDDGCWLAHPEFVEDGISQVRDVVLDGPYYLDPAAFEPGGSFAEQTETYIGRTTCTEAAAKEWWADSSKRSTPELQELDEISITVDYTREKINGSVSSPVKNYEQHGTPCASQAYGKTLGWAFKSNKWFISWPNVLGGAAHWDIINIFHTYKPDNETHGDKNPLVISTSWGFEYQVSNLGEGTKYVNYRGSISTFTDVDSQPNAIYYFNNNDPAKYGRQQPSTHPEVLAGEDVVNLPRVFIFNAAGNSNQKITYPGHDDYNNWINTDNNTPAEIELYFNRVGFPGHLGFNEESPTKYLTISVGALMHSVKDDVGVLKEQRADYSNMGPGIDVYAPGNRALAALNDVNEFPFNARYQYYPIGRYDDPNSLQYLNLPAGGVGNFGNLIDQVNSITWTNFVPFSITDSAPPTGGTPFSAQFYLASDGTLRSKITDPGSGYSIGDQRSLTLNGEGGGTIQLVVTHLLAPYDNVFAGTSSACPVAAGFYACFLQRRRNWNALKLKKYIHNSLEEQNTDKFYRGPEATSVNDSSFADASSLQGGSARIPYIDEPPSISISSQPSSQTVTEGNSVTFSVIATETVTTGALSYQWQRSLDNGSTWSDISGATSSSYSFITSNSYNNNRFRAIISGTFGVDDTATNPATLSVQADTPDPDPDPDPNPGPTPPPPTGTKNYLNAIDWTVLMGIKPKQYLYNRFGSEIYNKKEIFPKSFSIFSQEDCEIKIIRQKACPEFAYMHQEGYRWALLPEERRIKAKFSVNNFNINEPTLGITSDATSHTATLAYAGAIIGANWRSPTDSANYSVANNEELRVVGDDLFQLAITQKYLSGVNSSFKLNRIIGGGYLSSRDPDIETENVYLPFTYAPVGEYSDGYEVEFDYYRRDQTLISSVNIISDEFFIFWTGGGRGGIDSSHSSTIRIGFTWPDVSNSSSLIHVSRNADEWGIETPADVGEEFVSYDGQNFYEGVPVDLINNYSENTLYIETNTELGINTYNLEKGEYDGFNDFWSLGGISVPGTEGGECHGLGCKAGRELREAEIVVYEEDQGDGNFINVYYLQDLSPWPSLGEPYSITIAQDGDTITTQVNNPTTKVVGDAIVYLLPLGALPNGLELGDVEVSYNIIYIATIDKQSRVRSILTSKIAPGDLPYVRVFIQGRQGASMGGMWIGQKTPNGIILDPFTPHRSTVNIKDSGSESHGESFDPAETNGAIKVINTFTQIDNFGRSTAPTFDNSIDSLNTYKSIHTNPRKCGSFLSAGGTNAAGILTPTDYPIRWLTDKNSGLPLATFYVSKNESVEISLEEIFNVDAESVVNSDDANLATIFIARSLNNHTPAGSRKEIYMTLNYDEQ